MHAADLCLSAICLCTVCPAILCLARGGPSLIQPPRWQFAPRRGLTSVQLLCCSSTGILPVRSNLRVVTEVTRSLEFSPLMHSLAERVIRAIAARSAEYNAVHLRIEKDARDWSQIMGGPEVCCNTVPAFQPACGAIAHAASASLAPSASNKLPLPWLQCLRHLAKLGPHVRERLAAEGAAQQSRMVLCGLFNVPHRCVMTCADVSGCGVRPQAVWNAYVLSMRQAGFTAAVPMYAASGLLTYGASEDMEHIIATLQAAGLCSEVLYKELYIPQPELDGAFVSLLAAASFERKHTC